jgi:hypothetical protein
MTLTPCVPQNQSNVFQLRNRSLVMARNAATFIKMRAFNSLRKILSEITVTACIHKTGLVACGVRRLIREIALISAGLCEASDHKWAKLCVDAKEIVGM